MSSADTLKRIQKETQRVKRRLTNDSDRTPPQQQQNNHHHQNHHPVQVSAPHRIHQHRQQEKAPELILEPSTGSYFEDPVPANQMSNHLKNEHEAFKARYVEQLMSLHLPLLYDLVTLV